MPPLLNKPPMLLKLAKILEALELLDDTEATLKLAAAESIPIVGRELLNLNVPPNPDPSRLSLANMSRHEPHQMVGVMEREADRHVKLAKEFLCKDFAVLLQIMLISEGVSPEVIPRIPITELDDKLLQFFGRCLIAEECEEDEDSKKTPQEAKKRKTPLRVLKEVEEEEESSTSAVAEWLRGRRSVFGEHVTSCIDRTIGLGTDLLFLKGLSRLTGGTLKNLLRETKELSDALNNSSEIGGVESATANAKATSKENSVGEAKK